MTSPSGEAQAQLLDAWARFRELGLEHDRIAELAPTVIQRLSALSELWSVDVTGVEMAINFCQESADGT